MVQLNFGAIIVDKVWCIAPVMPLYLIFLGKEIFVMFCKA